MAKRRANGEGSIYQRKADNRWVGSISTPDGKRHTKYGKTQKEVRDWLTNERKALQSQLWVSDSHETVGAYLDRYLRDVVQGHVEPTTYYSYEWLMNTHVRPAIGDVQLAKLTPQRLQALYSDRLRAGLSPTTVNRLHNVFHKALKQAVRWGLVAQNVSDLVDPPKGTRRETTIWTPEQVRAFLAAARAHRYYALFVLAIYTGMRQGELLGLQVENIDWVNSSVNVRYALQMLRKGQGHKLSTPKTEKSRRSIVLAAPALAALADYVRENKRTSGYVFVSKVGTPIYPHVLWDVFKEILNTAGLPDIRFHDLRHTCATLHLAAGTNPKVVQEILGHSTITLTLDTYSHVIKGVQNEAAGRLQEFIESKNVATV